MAKHKVKKGKTIVAPKGLPQKGGKKGKLKRTPNLSAGRGSFMMKGKRVY